MTSFNSIQPWTLQFLFVLSPFVTNKLRINIEIQLWHVSTKIRHHIFIRKYQAHLPMNKRFNLAGKFDAQIARAIDAFMQNSIYSIRSMKSTTLNWTENCNSIFDSVSWESQLCKHWHSHRTCFRIENFDEDGTFLQLTTCHSMFSKNHRPLIYCNWKKFFMLLQ